MINRKLIYKYTEGVKTKLSCTGKQYQGLLRNSHGNPAEFIRLEIHIHYTRHFTWCEIPRSVYHIRFEIDMHRRRLVAECHGNYAEYFGLEIRMHRTKTRHQIPQNHFKNLPIP